MTNTLSPLSISKNKNDSGDYYRETTPIIIDPKKCLLCNKKCSLDTDNLSSINKGYCDLITNNKSLPYISLNFVDDESVTDKKKPSVSFNNEDYYLHYILILDGHIHKNPNTSDKEYIEILMLLVKDTKDSNEDNLLCLSVFAHISDRLTSGSEFFSQIFDVLKKDKSLLNKYIRSKKKNNNTTGDYELKINTDSNWSPSMIIPSSKTFYRYKGTFPLTSGGDHKLNNEFKKCNWIIFDESTTIQQGTLKIIKKMLNPAAGNTMPLNTITNSQKIPNNPVYKYIDSKYRDKLKPEDLVVKCEKNGECGAGELENNDNAEFNGRLNKCPLTLCGKELDQIYSSYLTDIMPSSANLTLIVLSIVLNICAVIIGYVVAKLCMKSYHSNPILQLVSYIASYWESKKNRKEEYKKTIAGAARGGVKVVGDLSGAAGLSKAGHDTLTSVTALAKPHGSSHAPPAASDAPHGSTASGGSAVSGGNLIDQHTRFVNHYNQIRH